MRLCNVSNMEKFFEAINKCQGDVYLTTEEGDRLNLKSQLTKMLALTTVFQHPIISSMNLEFSNPADVAVMLEFSMEGAI